VVADSPIVLANGALREMLFGYFHYVFLFGARLFLPELRNAPRIGIDGLSRSVRSPWFGV